ncbi:MAG: ribosome maturation factor RimP [Bacteriovoracaceae bacterium]
MLDEGKPKTEMEAKFANLCTQVLKENQLELYDIDYYSKNHELKVYILDPKTGSAVIEDCIRIDKALTPYFDEESWVPDQLVLEVSSPGMFRRLKTKEHFEMVVGDQICLHLKKALGESWQEAPKKLLKAKKVIGVLKEVIGDGIQVEFVEDETTMISWDSLKKANLEPNL